MAQIRKFQPGGTLTINGKQYTAQQINEYINQAGFSPEERAAIAGTVNAIASGAQVHLDRNANTLSGENVQSYFADFYGNDKKASKNVNRNANWARRQSRWNTDHHVVNQSISKLGGIEDFDPAAKKKNGKTGGENTLRKASEGFFRYDKDGNYIDNAENYAYMDLINRTFNYLNAENRDDWDTDAWSDTDLKWLHDWYDKNIGYETDFRERLKTGKFTNDDLNFLSVLGLKQSAPEAESRTQQNLFNDLGYDYTKFGKLFDVNDKGQIVIKTDENGNSILKSVLGGNGNYWFNEQFATNYKDLDFLKDHILVNGILYKAGDAGVAGSDLYNFLRQKGGFYDLNKSGDWVKANDIIKQYWDNQERNNYKLASETDVALEYLRSNPNIRWNSVNGIYDYNLPSGHQLLEIYDPNQTDIDAFGQGKTHYVVLDENGKFIKQINDIAELGNKIKDDADPLLGRQIINNPESIYHGMEKYDPNGTGISFYWDPKTKRLIYNGDIEFASNTDGMGYAFPKEVAEILMSNPKFIDNLFDPNIGLLKQFQTTLGSTVNSGFRDMWRWGVNDMSKENWIELGFTPEQAAQLENYFENFDDNNYAGSRDTRRRNRLVPEYVPVPVSTTPVSVNKMGGKLEYIKRLQPGGTIGTTKTQGYTEKKLNTPFVDPKKFHEFGDEGGLTGADWADIGGLVADTAGIGLGISGAPIASGVAGAIGSTAGFAADIARDGLDWGDAGNYILNLGLDTLSIIPWVGSAAQPIKVVNKIRKFAKPILKLFANPLVVKSLAAMGVGSAVKTSVEKIINGENWTVRDIRNVVSGLSGALTLKKTGIFSKPSTKVDVGEIDVKIRGQKQKIELNEDDMKAILNTSGKKEDVEKALKKIIRERPEFKVNGRKPSDSQIDFSISDQEKSLGWRFWEGKKPNGKFDFKLKQKTISDITPEGLKDGSQNKQRFIHYLRTGEWKTLDNAGNIVNETAENLLKRKPFGQQTHQLYLPKHYWYTPDIIREQAGYIAQPVEDPYAHHFKDGGKIQFAKNGKILKGQNDLIVPEVQSDPIETLGLYSEWDEERKARFKAEKAKAEESGQDFIFDGYNFGKVKGTPIPTEPDKVDMSGYLPEFNWSKVIDETLSTPYVRPKKQRIGSPLGETQLLDWDKIGAIGTRGGRIAGELTMTLAGINKQHGYADKNRRLAKSVYTINDPEYYGSFSDNGEKSAYDQEANRVESQASQNLTSDPRLNRLFRRQASAEARQLRLQGKLSQSNNYSKFKQDQLARRAAYAEARTANLNKDILRHLNADASYNIESGKATALKTDAWKGAITDAIGMYNQQKLGGIQSELTNLQRKADDWYAGQKKLYDDSTTIDKTKYATFDQYLQSNPALKAEYRGYQDNMNRLYSRAALYRKKGGKMRSTEDQIKIDKEKAKHKQIEQLSKQAFELLKKALS